MAVLLVMWYLECFMEALSVFILDIVLNGIFCSQDVFGVIRSSYFTGEKW